MHKKVSFQFQFRKASTYSLHPSIFAKNINRTKNFPFYSRLLIFSVSFSLGENRLLASTCLDCELAKGEGRSAKDDSSTLDCPCRCREIRRGIRSGEGDSESESEANTIQKSVFMFHCIVNSRLEL